MRVINLADASGSMRPFAVFELQALAALPTDDDSFRQALAIYQIEFERWKALEEKAMEEYEPTWLAQTILTALKKQVTRRYVAGLVGVAMQMLPHFGRQSSLESASQVVCEYANSIGKTPFVFWEEKNWSRKEKSIVGDKTTIQRIFRKYRPVAHICAAEIACVGYLEPKKPFELSPVADACFIRTCIMYQQVFEKVANFSDWDLIHIQVPRTKELSDAVPLVPDSDTMVNLFTPWLKVNGY